LRDTEGDFEIRSVEVHNGPAALTSPHGDIVDHQNDPATDVQADAISLDAPLGLVGNWDDNGWIDVAAGSGGVSTNALGQVLLRAPGGNLPVGEVASRNHLRLLAEEGSIVAAQDGEGYARGRHIVLESRQGSIGTRSRALAVGPHEELKATAENDLRLRAPYSSLVIDRVVSRNGNVELWARENIVECYPFETKADVRGVSVDLRAKWGSIGRDTPGSLLTPDYMDLDVVPDGGHVDASARNGVYLNNPEEFFLIGLVTCPSRVSLAANGSILDHDGGNGIDVHGGNGVALHSRNGTVGQGHSAESHLNVSGPVGGVRARGASVHVLPHRDETGRVSFTHHVAQTVVEAGKPNPGADGDRPNLAAVHRELRLRRSEGRHISENLIEIRPGTIPARPPEANGEQGEKE
jgi:hypothetical protein